MSTTTPRESIEQATDRAEQLAVLLVEISQGMLTRGQFADACGIAGIHPQAAAAVIESYLTREQAT